MLCFKVSEINHKALGLVKKLGNDIHVYTTCHSERQRRIFIKMLHFVQHDSKRIQHTTNPLCITANQFCTTTNPLNTSANQFETTANPFSTTGRSDVQKIWIAVMTTGGEPSVEPPPGGL